MNVATNKWGERVAAIKKGTKLTDDPKDYMLRVRLNNSILTKLNELCEKEDKSRSQIVRELIVEKYQNNKE